VSTATLPRVAGKLTANAPLAPLVWFKSGGAAEWLFEPKDVGDLQQFLRNLDPVTPVMALGLGSNLIVRDGGVSGVVVRLGKAFGSIATEENQYVKAGGGASGIAVASAARDAGIMNFEFFRGIPGTIGGFVRMNAGCYGSEVADILITAKVLMRNGEIRTIGQPDLHYSYRHSELPADAIVIEALFQGEPDEPADIASRMEDISARREASQPLRSKTGGSTFKNPEGHKAWQLVDDAGCRGLQMGGAQVSEKHTNFMINTGDATSADIEALGEEVRTRVKAKSGIDLHWEIQRVGVFAEAPANERMGNPA
jgi:UDP-N-acetylmuramate dehydrogenase